MYDICIYIYTYTHTSPIQTPLLVLLWPYRHSPHENCQTLGIPSFATWSNLEEVVGLLPVRSNRNIQTSIP